MEKLIDLRDLLKHEILDLHSAEEQIIEALPGMIEKANNGTLKKALSEHLKLTENHKKRLEDIQAQMNNAEAAESGGESESENGGDKKPGFFSRLFGGGQKCRGMEGLITEGEKMLGEDMSPEVMDAAIIAASQKIEHYEICGYGTARAFARELNLGDIASMLTQTLNEEYRSDDLLTELAVGKLNVEAEFAEDNENGTEGRKLRTSTPAKSVSLSDNGKTGSNKPSARKAAPKKAPLKSSGKVVPSGYVNKAAIKKTPSKKVAPKKASAKKIAVKKTGSKKVASKKAPVKKTASKKAAPKKALVKKIALKKVAAKKAAPKKVTAKKSAVSRGRRR